MHFPPCREKAGSFERLKRLSRRRWAARRRGRFLPSAHYRADQRDKTLPYIATLCTGRYPTFGSVGTGDRRAAGFPWCREKSREKNSITRGGLNRKEHQETPEMTTRGACQLPHAVLCVGYEPGARPPRSPRLRVHMRKPGTG